MANTIKIKRGTNLSNITTAPVAGELIYDSNLKKLYVGDGATAASALTAIGGNTFTTAAVTDSATTLATGNDIYDFVTNLGYLTSTTFSSNGMLSTRGTADRDSIGDSSGLTVNYSQSTGTNKPTGTDHSLLTMSYSSAWQNQIAQDWRNNGRMFIRGQNSGTWSSWYQVYSSADTIPLANGGTGATSASSARTNLQLGDLATVDNISAGLVTSGTFADARIPSLAASKITSGTFAPSRIPIVGGTNVTLTSTSTQTNINVDDKFLKNDADDTWSGNISTTGTNGIRFGSANQTDGNDGYIAAGKFASGLNIVGTQTTTGTGRQVRVWGDLIDSGGSAYLTSVPNHSGALITSGTIASARLDADTAHLSTTQTFTGAKTFSSSINAGYGVALTNGTTNFLLYNNTNENLLYMRDTTNGAMLQTWGVNLVTMNKPLSVVGNITVTGAVDGRDIANDGTKLDGIEASATADQTAAQILTSIKTVDGAGSGLDADLLDGIDSGAFLRSNTADTIGAQLTMGTQTALVASNYGHGVFGVYSASKYQHVWSMGTSYKVAADGASTGNIGNLYGLAWSYNPDYGAVGNNAQSKVGLGHQLLLASNGTTRTALGTGIWTQGHVTLTNNKNFQVEDAQGNIANLIKLDTGNAIRLGDATHVDQIAISTSSTTNAMIFNTNGTISLNGNVTMSSPATIHYGAVINNTQNNSDTIIKGVNDANLIYADASANSVGIGTNVPTSKLHIYNGNGSIPDDANNHVLIEDDGHCYLGIGGGTSSDTGIHFMDSGGIRGRVAYHHAADTMTFKTSNALAMTIQANGNIMLNAKAITGVSGIYGNSGTFIGYNTLYQFKNTTGGILATISGSTLDIPNTGDWSYIKNATTSGGLRFGTNDSGGTYANQIEISNTGNYVKLNENTTVTGTLTTTGNATIGNSSNPTLSIMNTATGAGSGPTLEFGHNQGGGSRAGAIKTYLTDGSTTNRTALLRLHHTHSNVDILKLQLGDNYVRQYQKGDTSDYLETMVHDTHAEFHVASGNYIKTSTDSGYALFGPQNTSWNHIYTSAPGHLFDKYVTALDGHFQSYSNVDLSLRRSQGSADRIDITADYSRIIVNNSERFRATTSGATITGHAYATSSYLAPDGSATTPAYRFNNDGNTGMYLAGTDTIGFSTNGGGRFTMNATGVLYVSDYVQAGGNGIHIWDATHGFKQVLGKDSTYTKLLNNDGNVMIYMGDSGDAQMYYQGNEHRFRNLAGSAYYATISSTGIVHTSSSAFTMGNIANKIRIQTDGVDDFSFLNTGNGYANTWANNVYAASKLETAGYVQTNSSGTLLRLIMSSWTNATTHDVIYNSYQTTLGDYTYLKSAGNSTTTHGMLLNSDNYLFWGRDDLTTGAVDNSATAPMTDVCMRVDSSGNALFDGDVVAYSSTIASDARLKENVKDLDYGLKDIMNMRAVSFDWIDKRNGQHDIGVIAQEIEKIIPEVVAEVDTLNSDDKSHKTVDYGKLTSVLIKAIQEQQVQIDELKECQCQN